MSYEIIYDKQFIKVSEDKFVPMILSGSNNCYEWSPSGKERRTRSWFPFSINNQLVLSVDEMVKHCEQTRQDIITRNESREKDEWYDEYSDSAFGYWTAIAINGTTANTTYGQFKGVFTTGCKKALTVEQLANENIFVHVKNSYYSQDKKDELGIDPFSKVVRSGQELLDAIEECKKQFDGTKIGVTIEFSGMYESTTKWLRKKYFPRPQKKIKNIIEVDEYYTILVDNNYLVKRTRNGYRYTYYPYLKFMTKKEAEVRVKRLNKKYKDTHTIEKVKERARVEFVSMV